MATDRKKRLKQRDEKQARHAERRRELRDGPIQPA
jgi:hypothetical protein